MMLTFVISTPGNPERLKNVQKQMTSQGLNLSDYELVEAEMIPKHPPRGIVRSFKKCIQLAKDRGAKQVNIFEDDMLFTSKNSYSKYLDSIPETYDVYLGGIYDGDVAPVSDELAKVTGKLSGLHCIIVPEHFYDPILNANEDMNLDYTISQTLKADMYVMYPMGIIQNDGYSYNARQITSYNPYLHTRYKILKS